MIQSSLADGLPLSEENLTASNLKAALLKLVKDQPVGGIGDGQDPSTLPSTAPASTAELRQQAEQLLTSIERTQVLNSLNHEKGQPLTFQIPFALDGRTGTAEFYVEQREGDDPKEVAGDRHYTVVAFLELATIGPLRIDLALHQNHLSVKVTVEREETLRFTRALMLDLKEALDRQGFMVDFLSCERQPDVRVHHEDVKDRVLLSESHLISLRI
jgi:flagellar hook-length control protein FliK